MSYIGSKPANKPVVASDLDPAVITGQTALSSEPASTDEFLISDAGVLKRLDASLIGGGKILQVLQTAKTDTFTLGSHNAWTDVTGLSQAITPASTSNKVLINFSIGITSNAGANSHGFKIVRGSTTIGVGDAASSRTQTAVWDYPSENHAETQSFTFLDSPSTTSATTYKIQMYANDDAYVNRMSTDSDSDTYGRGVSTITLMEVAG